MRPVYEIIADKRDGKRLPEEDIRDFLNAYLRGEIADYQMSAMLMAICIRSLDENELTVWTDTMLRSGTILDFSSIEGVKVDKHSTGGVGDKISLPLAPVLAALDFKVPMISGRGLGHTGGTLDKLESIPGFSVDMSPERLEEAVAGVGAAIVGQSPGIVPLDKQLYALRDVTATVESIPLIASSIMSKKLAEGIDGLLLDVKTGNGAFMKTMEDARELGRTMKSIGENMGKKVAVLFTDMSEPLGYTVGNTLEVLESIDVLHGKEVPQVTELVKTMTATLLRLYGKVSSLDEGKRAAAQVLKNGQAWDKFLEMAEFQGADGRFLQKPELFPRASHTLDVPAGQTGIVTELNALDFGRACVALGGGRARKEDTIDHAVGFVLHKKVGDTVNSGDTVYTIHYNDQAKLNNALSLLKNAVTVGNHIPERALIIGAV